MQHKLPIIIIIETFPRIDLFSVTCIQQRLNSLLMAKQLMETVILGTIQNIWGWKIESIIPC